MIPKDFAGSYSAMSDDELLRLACDLNNLKAEARSALNGELQRRRLLQADIDAYSQHLLLTKSGELPGKQKFIARSFNGFGTGIYGKRDFRPDGSLPHNEMAYLFLDSRCAHPKQIGRAS